MTVPHDARGLAALLAGEGFVAADEEAAELIASAGDDSARLERFVARRRTGEPLAWITGGVVFCGVPVAVHPGVYVPRPQSELLAERAVARLPADGIAVDACTGCGALAAVLAARRPAARVVATEVDPDAAANARANGVEAHVGDLLEPVPAAVVGSVDVVCAVVPYVPTGDLDLLQRDTFTFESERPYHGGADGAEHLRRVIAAAPAVLRAGGALLLELGAGQPPLLSADLAAHGFGDTRVLVDADGDVRGIEATMSDGAA